MLHFVLPWEYEYQLSGIVKLVSIFTDVEESEKKREKNLALIQASS